jgi:hypothetical protein
MNLERRDAMNAGKMNRPTIRFGSHSSPSGGGPVGGRLC